jgi:hypothetical protein
MLALHALFLSFNLAAQPAGPGPQKDAIDPAAKMEVIRVAKDHRGFVLSESGQPFIPWGFNYDHDEQGRLLEDYWESDWPKINRDFS